MSGDNLILDEPLTLGKSYTEIEAEMIAEGKPVPPGIAMLAAAERSKDDDPRIAGLKWRPPLND